MQQNICIILDATNAGPFELFQFNAITKALEGVVDVYLAINGTEDFAEGNVISVSNKSIFDPNFNLKGASSLIPGNPDVKLLAVLSNQAFNKYNKFVRIEFDCAISEDILTTIQGFLNYTADYDVCYIGNYIPEKSPGWPWWKSFHNRLEPERARPGMLRGGMLQIFAFNRKFIECYREALIEGWTAHYEVLIPSVAFWNELKTLDLAAVGIVNLSVFSARHVNKFTSAKTNFYHPVKDFETFAKLPAQVIRGYLRYCNDVPEKLLCYRDIRMTVGEINLMKRYLDHSDRYLEFGSGGSTAMACYHGVQEVWSVETDQEFLLSILKKYDLESFLRVGRLHLLHIDIGRTGAWGAPVEPYLQERWPRYSDVNWNVIRPDLILIDARFRVAVAARAYIELHDKKESTVLIHDYAGREHYHIVSSFLDEIERVEGLSAFKMKPGKLSDAVLIYERYGGDFR